MSARVADSVNGVRSLLESHGIDTVSGHRDPEILERARIFGKVDRLVPLLGVVSVNAPPGVIRIRCLDVPVDANTETILERASREMLALDDGEGVLVLTDAFGSMPSNIACRLTEEHFARVVSGLNLPMLIRVFNYFTEDLDTLSRKAVNGGARGIHTFTAGSDCE